MNNSKIKNNYRQGPAISRLLSVMASFGKVSAVVKKKQHQSDRRFCSRHQSDRFIPFWQAWVGGSEKRKNKERTKNVKKRRE